MVVIFRCFFLDTSFGMLLLILFFYSSTNLDMEDGGFSTLLFCMEFEVSVNCLDIELEVSVHSLALLLCSQKERCKTHGLNPPEQLVDLKR